MKARAEEAAYAAHAASIAGELELALEILHRTELELFGHLADVLAHEDFEQKVASAIAYVRAARRVDYASASDQLAIDTLRGSKQRRTRRIVPVSVYDAVDIGPDAITSVRSFRLFGNSNVGWRRKTNLQVAGRIAESDAIITRWWVEAPTTAEGVIELRVMDRVVMIHRLETLRNPQPLFAIVRERADVKVLCDEIESDRNGDLVVHLDGWRYDEDR